MKFDPENVAEALSLMARGTASFQLRASFEQYLLDLLKKGGHEGVGAFLGSLPDWGFVRDDVGSSTNESRFRAMATAGLVVETFLTRGVASVNVLVEADLPSPGPPDPRHQAFYEVWEGFFRGPETPVDELPPWPKAVFLVGLLEAEVMNGGLGQYLTNTNGAFLRETLECLREIGAEKTGAILREAGSLGGKAESYVAAWESRSASFEELDELFLDSREDLAGLTADRFLNLESAGGST